MESDQARLYYERTMELTEGLNSTRLPRWFGVLNGDCRVYCNARRHFGLAWGEVVGDDLEVTCDAAGAYNVLLTGVRSDRHAVEEYILFGVEYPDPDTPQEETGI